MSDTRPSIVMVEDQISYQKVFELALRDAMDAQMAFATDGDEAIALLSKQSDVDLILLDLNIPKKSGEEVLRWIRSQPKFDTVPVIIVTGDGDHQTQCRLLENGANDFIEKGSPPEIFIARIRAQTRQKSLADKLTGIAIDMDLFAAGVLHDINGLESSVIAIAEFLRMKLMSKTPVDNQTIVKDLGQIVDQAHHISQYATSVIQRVRETHKEPKPTSTNVAEIANQVARLLNGQAGPESRQKISLSCDSSIQPILADAEFLQLACLNIFQNSFKYARPGVPAAIRLFQRMPEPGRSGGRTTVVTCFRDNGQGIQTTMLEKVFEPFVRAHGAGKQAGFGLGLAMVSKVVKAMGGRVWAESPGDGEPGVQICIELPN